MHRDLSFKACGISLPPETNQEISLTNSFAHSTFCLPISSSYTSASYKYCLKRSVSKATCSRNISLNLTLFAVKYLMITIWCIWVILIKPSIMFSCLFSSPHRHDFQDNHQMLIFCKKSEYLLTKQNC